MQPLSGNLRLDLLTSLMNMSLVLQIFLNVPRLPALLKLPQNPHDLLTFGKVQNSLRLYIFTWERASRHNGVHFLNISTSKSAPRMGCFRHFYFQVCFPPQRCALFEHLNFQKCSEAGVFWTFRLPYVIRATTACNFSSLISPDGSAPASLANLLFDPLEPQNIGKTQCFATFYLFAHLHLVSSDSFSSLIFFLLLFSSLALPASAFPSVQIVGNLTSKLPSATCHLPTMTGGHFASFHC